MDEQGSPSAETAVRVWIRIAPEGKTKLIARDRHNHKILITLSDLLAISTPHPASDTRKTQVRSTLKPEQDSAAE